MALIAITYQATSTIPEFGGVMININPAAKIAVMTVAAGKPIIPIENIIIRYHKMAQSIRKMTKPKK